MPWTDQDEARYQQLGQQLGYFAPPAAPPDQPSIPARIGEGFANLPSNVAGGLVNGLLGTANMFQPSTGQLPLVDVPKPYDIPPPQTLGQRVADLVPGIATTVATAAIPGGLVRSGLMAMGASPGMAALGGEFAGGALLGAPQGGGDALNQGAQFAGLGLLNTAPIPGYLKAIGNAAIPVGGQLLAGQNPLDQGNLLNTAATVIVPGLLGGYGSHAEPTAPVRDAAPEATPIPAPADTSAPVIAPTAAPAPTPQQAPPAPLTPFDELQSVWPELNRSQYERTINSGVFPSDIQAMYNSADQGKQAAINDVFTRREGDMNQESDNLWYQRRLGDLATSATTPQEFGAQLSYTLGEIDRRVAPSNRAQAVSQFIGNAADMARARGFSDADIQGAVQSEFSRRYGGNSDFMMSSLLKGSSGSESELLPTPTQPFQASNATVTPPVEPAPQATPEDAIRQAYPIVRAADPLGFSAVSNLDLQQASGLPMDQFKSALAGMSQSGEAIPTRGSMPVLDEGMQSAALTIGGDPHYFVQIRPAPIDPSIIAHHGTPHTFDEFDDSKVGTGEGNAAYGWGGAGYFAQNPDVADSYRPGAGVTVDDGTPLGHAQKLMGLFGDQESARVWNQSKIAESESLGQSSEFRRSVDAVLSGPPVPDPARPGNLYTVRIDAEPHELLDHDLPLQQQHPDVMRKITQAFPGAFDSANTGSEIYDKLAASKPGIKYVVTYPDGTRWPMRSEESAKSEVAGTPGASYQPIDTPGLYTSKTGEYGAKGASMALKEAGIKGIQYRDAGSRAPAADGTEARTRNYVIFDPKHIKITHKNGTEIAPEEAVSGVRASRPPPDAQPGSRSTPDTIANAMRDVAAKYPGVDLRVHASPADAPELQGKINPRTPYEGLNDPQGVNRNGGKGVQYGFTDNLSTPERAQKVALHEIVGHYGVDKILPAADWKGIQDHVMANGGALRDAIAKGYGNDPNRIAREYVAKVAENTNLDPNLWQSFTAMVRKALRAAGIRRDWSDAEIQDLVRSAHRNLKEGGPSLPQVGPLEAAASRRKPLSDAERTELAGLQQQSARSPDLLTSTQKARMSLLGSAPDARPAFEEQRGLLGAPIKSAYDRLSKSSGFPSVAISDLSRESGVPLEQLKPSLLAAHNEGRATLSLGDWSNSDETRRAGATDTAAQKGNLLVRMNEDRPQQGLLGRRDTPRGRDEQAAREAVPWGKTGTLSTETDAGRSIFHGLSRAFGTKDALDMISGLKPYPQREAFEKGLDNSYWYDAGDLRSQVVNQLRKLGQDPNLTDLPSPESFNSGKDYFEAMSAADTKMKRSGAAAFSNLIDPSSPSRIDPSATLPSETKVRQYFPDFDIRKYMEADRELGLAGYTLRMLPLDEAVRGDVSVTATDRNGRDWTAKDSAPNPLVDHVLSDLEQSMFSSRNEDALNADKGDVQGWGLLGARALDPSIRSRMDDAAKEQEEGKKTFLGAATRFLQTNFNMDRSPELKRIMEQSKGVANLGVEKMNEPARGLLGYAEKLPKGAPMLQPAQDAALAKFNKTKGDPADEAAMRAAVPKPIADYAASSKQQQIEGQAIKLQAEAGAKRATTIKNMGDYVRRTFEIFANPQQYSKRLNRGDYKAALAGAVQYFKEAPEFRGISDSFMETHVRQVLNNLAENKPFDSGSESEKISQSLYLSKKDLSNEQWAMMEKLQSDPRLSTHDQGLVSDALRKQFIDPATQKRLGEIAEGGALSKPESSMLSDISERETLDPRIRALFGEYTNPIDQIAWTNEKVARSVKQAKAITDIAFSSFSDGRKMAYKTPRELDNAIQAAAGETKRTLMRYKQLPDSDGYGILAKAFAPMEVHDALNSFNQGMESGADQFWGKIQKVLKLNATVLNPATHAHWWMQMPLMMAMARVYNPADWYRAERIVNGNDAASAAVRDELTKNNILQVGAQRDLGDNARKVSTFGELQDTFTKIKTGGDKAIAFLGKLYGKPDDIIRTAAYMTEKARALKEGLGEQDAQNRATDFTNKYTFNYDALPRAVRFASNVPGLNPFLSYSAELGRITKNIAQDVISGSAGDRMHGALNLALMAAVPLAASLGSSQMNLSAKDQQDWDRMRKLEDEDQKAQIKFVLGRDPKTGAFKYVDVGSMLPASDIFTAAKNIATGNWKGFALDQPVIGLQHSPVASLGIDLTTGQNQFTGQKLFTPSDYAARIWQGVTPPILGSQAVRDIKSFSPNAEGGLGLSNPRTGRQDTPITSLLGHAGIRLQSETQASLLGSALADAQDKRDAARGQLMQVARPDATPEAKAAAANAYGRRLLEINSDLQSKLQ